MSTKIQSFLGEKKIDPRRILVASAEIERLRREDRGMILTKRQARKGEDAQKKKDAAALKPRTGRPVTQRAIDAVLAGKEVSGPVKTRILRAVNHVLVQKKQAAVEMVALFDPTPRPARKKEKKADE